MKGRVSVSPFVGSLGIFFVDSIDKAKFLHEK